VRVTEPLYAWPAPSTASRPSAMAALRAAGCASDSSAARMATMDGVAPRTASSAVMPRQARRAHAIPTACDPARAPSMLLAFTHCN